jgi:hypothetical protein
MTRYTPPSIKDIGLKNHLDLTKKVHNGYGYDDFVKMRQPMPPVNPVNMARIFGVTRATMTKWIEIYNTEKDD